ncbi:MAG: hypothetical protein ABFS34_11825 [Gemmatimonadota bacterium]
MRQLTILALAAVLAAGTPAVLVGQDPEDRVAAALQQAAEAGVPLSLLESKIAEGRAKGVPMARIATAVEQRLGALQQAQALMQVGDDPAQNVSDGDLSLGADALLAGVDGQAVSDVARNAPRERLGVAMAVLTQLVQMGVASQTALDRVTAALELGPGELMALPAQAQGQRAQGRDGQRGPPAGVPTPGAAPQEPPGKSGNPPGRRRNN